MSSKSYANFIIIYEWSGHVGSQSQVSEYAGK